MILFAVILFLCTACSSDKETNSDNKPVQLSQTYKNETEGFSFKYPKDWQVKKGNISSELIKIQSPDGMAKIMVFKIVTNPFGILTDDQEAVKNAVNEMHEFVSTSNIKFGDIPVKELVYQTNGLKGDYISKNYFYVLGGNSYQVICSFKISEREKYEPIIEAIVKSYTVTGAHSELSGHSTINIAEAKTIIQTWVNMHKFPSSVSITDGDEKPHKLPSSNEEYYMFQLQGLHRVYDILVDVKTKELFVYETGKPEKLEPWYHKYIEPYVNTNNADSSKESNYIDKNFEWVERPHVNNENIIGKIKNISTGERRKISISFLLYDYQGNQIGTTVDITPILKEGIVWSFKAPVHDAKVTDYELGEINYQ